MSLKIEDITRVTLANRAPDLIDSITQMNALLYGDTRKYTRWEKFVMRWKWRRERVRDAWLVLTGQAHIGDW
jgi:hypothetical protein